MSALGDRELLSPAECARVFGVGRRQWVIAFDRGDVEGVRLGRRRKIYRASARAYLERISGARPSGCCDRGAGLDAYWSALESIGGPARV